MKKVRQILAIAGIVLLVAIYASTLVFALMKDPRAEGLLMASVFCTVAVPVLLYAMLLVAKNLEQKGEELRREDARLSESSGADETGRIGETDRD